MLQSSKGVLGGWVGLGRERGRGVGSTESRKPDYCVRLLLRMVRVP